MPLTSPQFDERSHPRPDPAAVLSVSALNRLARATLEKNFPLLRVAGEISNLTRAPSGHVYFTLKDDQAQVRCTMWRNRAQLLPFRPDNGMQVEARALVTLYEARGDFQLNVEGLRQAGTGSLYEAFVRLRDKLEAEGLFDPSRKRPLPRFPRRVGVVTSPSAAAFQDVLAALRRRAPHLEVALYPAPVQGEGAAQRLREALVRASARSASDGIDVLLLVRGGGSLEDLWAFNDEALARAIGACTVPVVCGVGHETDVTIADFAADVRAATPTGAAELVSAGFHEAAQRLTTLGQALSANLRRRIDALAQRLDRASLRVKHPRERLALSRDTAVRLRQDLAAAMRRRLERATMHTQVLGLRLRSARPDLRRATERQARCADRLAALGARIVAARAERLDALAAHLEHLGPPGVLARGYSITRDADGKVVRAATEVAPGSALSIELAHGRLGATVTRSEP
ncbi:MAG TPA: exodeoxyribonuclease VII large subunit [Rhodocyclaceae bacterium]|nr:exodeoxyribonuclease VII large subunit [Rhodocyclaceae bacterium]